MSEHIALIGAGPGGEDQAALTGFFDGRIRHHVTGANHMRSDRTGARLTDRGPPSEYPMPAASKKQPAVPL